MLLANNTAGCWLLLTNSSNADNDNYKSQDRNEHKICTCLVVVDFRPFA